MTQEIHVIVELPGGAVNDVYCDSPDVEVMLIGFETEGMDVEDLRHLPKPHYSNEHAHAAIYDPADPGDFDGRWKAATEAPRAQFLTTTEHDQAHWRAVG